MYTKRQKVNIDDTRFIFTTNFSGDPERDRFGSDQRRVNVVIPTEELAQHLLDLGVKVKQTKPNPERTYDEPFVPTLYVPVNIKMDSKWPPHIYWVTTAGKRLLCNEDTISQLDFIRVKNVCLHYLCQLLSVFLIQTFGKIYDIQIININDSWLKFCFLYTMDHIDLHALSTLDSWDCCFHALCISNNKRSANFISLWLH